MACHRFGLLSSASSKPPISRSAPGAAISESPSKPSRRRRHFHRKAGARLPSLSTSQLCLGANRRFHEAPPGAAIRIAVQTIPPEAALLWKGGGRAPSNLIQLDDAQL